MSKSVEELFKDAPEGATHFLPALSQAHSDVWFKIVDGYAVSAGYDRLNGWAHSYTKDCQPSTDMTRLISRKDDETKPWSGPEDGLPPINMSCQMQDDIGQWVDVLIIANHEGYAHGWQSGEQDCFYSNDPSEFRAILTPAQLRETAIREFMDVVGIDCRVTASKAVDAGFKREVV